MAEYDNLCKILAEKYPHDFIRWLLNEEPRTIKILKTELSIEPIHADSVIFLQTDAYTEILAGLRYKPDLILQLLREETMQESTIYQYILDKGEKRGEQRGEQQEAFRFLKRQLERRFGEIDSAIIERIRVLSTAQLEALGEDFLDFSQISDLIAWLNRQAI